MPLNDNMQKKKKYSRKTSIKHDQKNIHMLIKKKNILFQFFTRIFKSQKFKVILRKIKNEFEVKKKFLKHLDNQFDLYIIIPWTSRWRVKTWQSLTSRTSLLAVGDFQGNVSRVSRYRENIFPIYFLQSMAIIASWNSDRFTESERSSRFREIIRYNEQYVHVVRV